MASSRIFIRGIPPTLSSREFEQHFSSQCPITDAKFFPNRRIGYVGFQTPEDAAKAVKYFNKSFIRMSKIGVEFALPVAEASTSKYNSSLGRNAPQNESVFIPSSQPSEAAKSLKRKRETPPDDPKLKEFLQVMQPPSKARILENSQNDVGSLKKGVSESTTHQIKAVEGNSDEEYQDVRKKNTSNGRSNQSRPPENEEIAEHGSEEETTRHDRQAQERNTDSTKDTAQDVTQQHGVSMSDADWLRARTNRVLDLINDDDAHGGIPIPSADERTEKPVVSEIAVMELKHEPTASGATGGGVVDGKADEDLQAIRKTGRLFVRNLPYSTAEEELREPFGNFGEIEEAHIPSDSRTGVGKGFAYVQYINSEHAVAAYQSLDGTILQGRLLHILPASAKTSSKLDEFAISQLPLKKQKEIKRKAEVESKTFNWNSLYMSADAVLSSVSDRLGVSKSEILDPTSSDAAVKQAQAETHVIQETKAYFLANGVDIDAFTRRERGDNAILVKNFPYGTTVKALRDLFEQYGQVSRLVMPPAGTIAIVEFPQPSQARVAFKSLAYRKVKESILFLEKAPKDIFSGVVRSTPGTSDTTAADQQPQKLSTSELLQPESTSEVIDTSTLFVRNLSFSTTTERLRDVFKPLDGFMSARVKTKPDPKNESGLLSMGFGFLEFRSKAQAQAALEAMNGYNLDGHNLVIKASHKGLDAAEERRKQDKADKAAARHTKIIIKNLPFEASKKDVRALFGAYGQLRSVRVPKKFDSSARGFAFADFTTPREAESAMNALRHTHLLGRRLVLDFAADDPLDAEEEIEKMQSKVESQVNKVAMQKLLGSGRKKVKNIVDHDNMDDG